MAAITFTPGEVQPGTNANREQGTAGGTIGQGQGVYKDVTDSNRWKLAANNDAESSGINGVGIAANGASVGQPVTVITSGDVDFGASQTGVNSGVTLCIGATPGEIVPDADVVATMKKTILGIVKQGGQVLSLIPQASNATI